MRLPTLLNIFDIQRFALHDGPGIRTVVFFQGCPLHCPWCANPESQKPKKRLLHFKSKCTACGRCAKSCPQKAISFVSNQWEVCRQQCIGCERCSQVCLKNAIKFAGEKKTIAEILAVVQKDADYYEASQGGLTVSGGEPFAQAEGLLQLLQAANRLGLHTAIETSGNTAIENILAAEPYTDLFLFDLKHCNAEIFHEITGGDLPLILRNISVLANKSPEKITLRVPVIPTFNFDEETIKGIFQLAIERNIEKVELLPYHTLGKGKYAQMGLRYLPQDVPSLTSEDLQHYRQLGTQMGLIVT